MFLFSGDDKVGKVFEDPSVGEGVEDDGQQLACCCDDGLAGAALPDSAVEGVEIAGVADGDQRALDQRGARQPVA